MRVTLPLAAVAVVAISAAAAACSSGRSHAPTIAVTVVVSHGLPIEGATVVSTLGETILDSAVTGADGAAKVAMSAGAAVTAHEHDGGGRFTSVTIAGAAPGDVLRIPLLQSFAGGGVALPTQVSVTAPSNVTFATIAAGDACQNVESIGTPNNLSVEPWCVQRDGTVSVFALGFDSNLAPAAFGTTVDQPAGADVAVAVDTTPGAPVSITTTGVDTSSLFSFSASLEPMRKGQAIGPTLTFDAALSGSAALRGASSATSIIATIAISGPLGAQSVVRGAAPAASYTFSAADLLPPADALAVDTAFAGGRAGGEWDAPATTSASLVSVQIHWDDDLSNPHDWFLYEPASAATGHPIVRMPPLPSALSDFLAKPGNIADEFHVTYFSADFAGDVTHLDPFAAPPPDSFTFTSAQAEQPL